VIHLHSLFRRFITDVNVIYSLTRKQHSFTTYMYYSIRRECSHTFLRLCTLSYFNSCRLHLDDTDRFILTNLSVSITSPLKRLTLYFYRFHSVVLIRIIMYWKIQSNTTYIDRSMKSTGVNKTSRSKKWKNHHNNKTTKVQQNINLTPQHQAKTAPSTIL
jgi:hypothetical protein